MGFTEAIGIAVAVVVTYLALVVFPKARARPVGLRDRRGRDAPGARLAALIMSGLPWGPAGGAAPLVTGQDLRSRGPGPTRKD